MSNLKYGNKDSEATNTLNDHNPKLKRITYTAEEILSLKDLPMSHQKLDLPSWFVAQAAKGDPVQELVQPSVVISQMRPMPTALPTPKGYASPIYTYGRPILGRTEKETPLVDLPRGLAELTLEPTRRVSTPLLSPRPSHHFHQRRVTPWNPVPFQPFFTNPSRVSWPIPYIKSFGVAHKPFPDNGTFVPSTCYY